MKKMKLTKYIITLMTALLVMGMTSNSVLATKFPVEYDNHKKVKKGGTLRVGYVHDGEYVAQIVGYGIREVLDGLALLAARD